MSPILTFNLCNNWFNFWCLFSESSSSSILLSNLSISICRQSDLAWYSDTSKLVLKNVIYDTGNTVTNFSKPFEGELLFGGLSSDGKSTIKKGKAFTLEFTPIGTVNNVTGLFYFENTDAVKANGDKINLNIQ